MQFNGTKLKDLRKRAGLTQKKLASEIGSTMPSVSNWEVGKNVPPYTFINRLCDYFQVEEDYFIHREQLVTEPVFIHIKDEEGKDIRLKFVEPDEYKTAGDVLSIENNCWEMAIDPVRCAFIGPVHGTIMVRNSAMEPQFNSRNAIAVKLMQNKNAITPGEIYYVIDNNQEGHLRRLYPNGPSSMRLVSNNPEKYPEYVLNYDQVFVVFKVKANIELF